ncbi:MAG: sirohydrochlorin chelatase [Ghiorsea sp.]
MNLLFVAHGSRLPAYQHEAEAFIAAWKNNYTSQQVALCYLELIEPSFQHALEEASSETYVVPLFLHEGWHFKHDITEHISHAKTQVTMLPALTFDKPLVEALYDRLRTLEAGNSAVVIYSHGSRSSETHIHLFKLATELQVKAGVTCSIALAFGEPTLAEVCQKLIDAGEKSISILPHFLFSGTWQQKLNHTVQSLRQDGQIMIRVAEPLGHHPEMLHMIEMEINALK